MELGWPDALARVRDLLARRPRVVLGIAGPPGAGKTTVARALVEDLAAPPAGVPGVVVGMDGFHLAHSVLVATGRVQRKGAIDTFDGFGYAALLARLAAPGEVTVWAPEFRREIEDSVANAIAVQPQTRLVVTEGNYLLVPGPPWSAARQWCTEVWYLQVSEPERIRRLTARHERYGRTAREAHARAVAGSDAVNAALVRATRAHADAVLRLPEGQGSARGT